MLPKLTYLLTTVTFTLFILIVGTAVTASAKTVISGTIQNKANKPIADASVTLMRTADSSIVAFSFSSPKGEFTIYYEGDEDALLLTVYGFNIQKYIQRITN